MLLRVASSVFRLLLLGTVICIPSSIDAQQTFLWQAEVTSDRLKIFSQVSSPNELVMNLKKGNVVNVVLEISVLGDKWCRVELPDQPDPAGYALCSGLTKLRSAATQDTHAVMVTLARREKVIATTPIETSPEKDQPKSAALTNKDILDMSHAGFPADILAAKIKATTCAFDTTPGDLKQLKAGGIPDSVILAMIEAPAGATTGLAGAIRGSSHSASAAEKGSMVGDVLPDEIGVYYRQNGIMKPIEPEIVNWQTGGVLKRQLTLGIDKGHVNGTVVKPHSGLGISRNASESLGMTDFYVRCPDGNSASEYQLLHLWEKGDRREFRAVTGGVFHESGGAKKNVVAFTFEKIGPRNYRIQIPNLAAGEYGLLAPGATASANVASQGKIYSFKILE
jgi:hypothetical protein